MRVCVDVDYRTNGAYAAAVVFHDWSDAGALEEKVVHVSSVEPYVPGEFFRRELPCLLAVLQEISSVETVVIDGYVWLDGIAKPGLGAHLCEALGQRVAVIGVAKTGYQGAAAVCEVKRGMSGRPLYISAAGVQPEVAAAYVHSMHGKFRIPTLLGRVDYLCRHGFAPC